MDYIFVIVFLLLLIIILVAIILIVWWWKNEDNNNNTNNYLYLSTLRTKYNILIASVDENNMKYANKYGYGFTTDIDNYNTQHESPDNSVTTENKSIGDYDYILFINRGIILTDNTMSLDRIIYLSEGSSYIFMIKSDKKKTNINSDIFLVKINTTDTHMYYDNLDEILANEHNISDDISYDCGYFYVGKNIAIFPQDTFYIKYDNIPSGTVHNPNKYTIVKKNINRIKQQQGRSDNIDCHVGTNSISKSMMQMFETLAVPNYMLGSINSFLNKHDSFNYTYTTNKTVLNLLFKLSSSSVNTDNNIFYRRIYQSYLSLIPGAYRADLWRLVYLYLYGGCYSDIKLYFINSIPDICDLSSDLVLCFDENGYDIYNAFMCARPGNTLIKKLIETICDNVESKYYGNNRLSITGPKMFKTVFDAIGLDLKLGTNITQYGKIQMLKFKTLKLGHAILNQDSNILCYTRQPGVNLRMQERETRIATGKQHYQYLWKNRSVYR